MFLQPLYLLLVFVSTSKSASTCLPGQYQSLTSDDCSPCQAINPPTDGAFCPVSGICDCREFTPQCLLVPNEICVDPTPCLANYYCPLGTVRPLPCPPNSTSNVGASSISQCINNCTGNCSTLNPVMSATNDDNAIDFASSTYTQVKYDVVTYQTYDSYDPITGSYKFSMNGTYLIIAKVGLILGSSSTPYYIEFGWFKNSACGNSHAISTSIFNGVTSSIRSNGTISVQSSRAIQATAGDTLTFCLLLDRNATQIIGSDNVNSLDMIKIA